MSISVIIPCYNSEKYIYKNIIKLITYNKKINSKYEIILIDDCSNDDTFSILKKIKTKYKNIRIIKNLINKGKSFSLIRGINKSKYNKIIIIDSDLPYLRELKSLVNKLKKFDMVFVDRRHIKSKNINKNFDLYQFFRLYIGYTVNFLIRNWFSIKIKDTQAGLKGFIKPNNFSKIKFLSKRFFFDLELILFFIKKGKKMHSLPTVYKPSNESSIKIFDIKKNFEIIKELFVIFQKYK